MLRSNDAHITLYTRTLLLYLYMYTGAGALHEGSTTGHRRGIARKSRSRYGDGEDRRGDDKRLLLFFSTLIFNFFFLQSHKHWN